MSYMSVRFFPDALMKLSTIGVFLAIGVVECKLVHRNHHNGYFLPDARKNTAEFCETYGYPAEEHQIVTTDNYILTIFRIPYSKYNNSSQRRPPVVLQHGIVLSSDQWVFRGPKDLPFLLSEAGYDVWMSNTRGTSYSKHPRYSKYDPQFWDYSIDELGLRDLPAIIDYVLQITNRPSLAYIGHSRGTAMATMLLSRKPQYNKKIHLLQFLGPVVYTKHARCPIYDIIGNRPTSIMGAATFERLIKKSGITTIFGTNKLIRSVLSNICQTGTMLDRICPTLLFFINGEDFKMFDGDIVPKYMSHFVWGVSSKEMVHLLQISEQDKFQMFNNGKYKNVEKYGSLNPPEYNISKVEPPVYLYYGPNDLFVSEKDLSRYSRQLPNFRSTYRIPYSKFNHVDYFWGKNTNEILFPRFLKDIDDFHSKMDKV